MIKIGVTGGIGAGKTTVCEIFQEKGAYVFDSDRIAKEIIIRSDKVRKSIEKSFNIKIIKNGALDTKTLADVAFSNKKNQEILNSIIHPEVIKEIDKHITKMINKTKLFVADIPLLFEAGLEKKFDYIILVVARFDLRVKRALKRGYLSKDDIIKRAQLQMPDEEKKKLADFVIENNGTVQELREKIDRLYEQIHKQK
ncbi:MAG: dephospho-CoA kinase [Candidatus Marinimicrobia bacterium]|nr:dephospho-CoA kinase [Candidatus Neomarinimicrobiota bacterium]